MKCPNCQKEIEDDSNQCIYCNANLYKDVKLFKILDEFKKSEIVNNYRLLNKEYKRSKKISIIVSILLSIFFINILLGIGIFSLVLNKNDFWCMNVIWQFNSIIKCFEIIGFFLLILSIFLFIKKYWKKSTFLIFIISIIIIISLGSFRNFMFMILNLDPSIDDYSRTQYIELGTEKIPSILSKVGYKKIIMAYKSKDCLDSKINSDYDSINLLYEYLSNKDLDSYKKYLIDYGFKNESLIINNEIVNMFVKDDLNKDEFYAVYIDKCIIVYFKVNGKYENFL